MSLDIVHWTPADHPDGRKRPKVWTPARLFELAGHIEQGRSDAWIAERMGTTANAVNIARKRRGIASRRDQLLSARRVAEELGISCAKTVTWWIRQGWLRGRRGQRQGPYRMWYVTRADLTAFLDNPAHWHLWEPDRLADHWLRRHYTQQRTERYLTVGEVAERCYVTMNTVNLWIRRGLLLAARRGNWLVPESALTSFVPPCQRSKVGMVKRAWTADEDARLKELRARGWTWMSIAADLGRSLASVSNRATRLGISERRAV